MVKNFQERVKATDVSFVVPKMSVSCEHEAGTVLKCSYVVHFHIGNMESEFLKLVAAETLLVPSPIGMSGNKEAACF